MSGMNPGFAAYLAAKKASKGAVSPAPLQAPMAPKPSNPMAGMMPMMASTVKGPQGKRHAKVTHVSTAHKKGK